MQSPGSTVRMSGLVKICFVTQLFALLKSNSRVSCLLVLLIKGIFSLPRKQRNKDTKKGLQCLVFGGIRRSGTYVPKPEAREADFTRGS